MDLDSAAFVLDRVDLARQALVEARQVVEKFSEQQDMEIGRLLDEMVSRVEQLDLAIRGAYPTP